MHRIDGPGHLLNHWSEGDPVTGEEPTEVTGAFMEALQEEILAVIESTGAAANKADNTQLLQAVSVGLINPWANRLLNTQFEFWQRYGDDPWTGTPVNHDASVDAAELVGPDRWFVSSGDVGGDADYTREEFALGTIPLGMESQGQPRYYLRWDQTVGASGVMPHIEQRIEGVRTFAGLKISVSFVGRVSTGTEFAWVGVRQQYGTGGSPTAENSQIGSAHTLTTTWTRFTSTFTLDPMTGKTIGTDPNDFLGVFIKRAVATTGIVEITDVRITPGITTNNTLLLPSWLDLQGCLRYYWKTYAPDVVPGINNFPGHREGYAPMIDNVASGVVGSAIMHPVRMRVPMSLGPALLVRGTNQIAGHQRVWRPGGTPTIGEIDWPSGNNQVVTGGQSTEVFSMALSVADTDLTSSGEVWTYHADFDAEIWLKF